MTKIERWIMSLCISREIREFVLGDLEEIAAAAAAGSNFKRTRGIPFGFPCWIVLDRSADGSFKKWAGCDRPSLDTDNGRGS